ncbi:hypothetical protein [Rhodopirellula bahusiensis]|uniref:hypothetical protein n=1 Tax=Rhodopirellula bahusiensis TaxID=2014065 RepID=UPI003264CA80
MLIRSWLVPCLCGFAIVLSSSVATEASAQQEGQDAARAALEAGGLANRLGGNGQQPHPNLAYLDVAPPLAYLVARQAYFQGELTRAIAILNQLEREAAASSTARHLLGRVSIRTLLGECHLQAGDFTTAAEHYEFALQIIVANPRFLSGIQWGALTSPTREPASERILEMVPSTDRPSLLVPRIQLVRTELDLWPSARNVPLLWVRRYLMAGVPADHWEVSPDVPDEFDQLRGLDVAETLRQLALSSYRLRWLRGHTAVLQDRVGEQLLAATVPPGVLGTDERFHAAGTLVAASRVALRYHAGDDSETQLVDPLDEISGGVHALTPISRLTRMRSLRNRWWRNRQIARGVVPSREGQPAVVLPSTQDLNAFIETAISTSEIAFALAQFQLAVDCFSLSLDELARWDDIGELATQVEHRLVARSEFFRTDAPFIAYQLRVLAARAALLSGRPGDTRRHLTLADRYRKSRRLDLPRSAAFARWLQLQIDATQSIAIARLDPEGDEAVNFQTFEEIGRRNLRWNELLGQCRDFARGVQSNDQGVGQRSITHPIAYRFSRIRDDVREQTMAATRSRRYQSHWRESTAGEDLSEFDQFCFELDRGTWTGLGVELAVEAGEEEQIALRMDEHQSVQARSVFNELPLATDLRCVLRQVLREEGRSLEDFLPHQDVLQEALQALEPSMLINPKGLGFDAAILHERFQAQLNLLALRQPPLRRVEPPPVTLRDERPDWSKLPDEVAIVSFHVDGDDVTGVLVHGNQASHWRVRDGGELRQQCELWLATILRLPTTVDEILDQRSRLSAQQLELELAQRLFPPLCGIDHPEIRSIIVVPDGFLWQLPFEQLVIRHDADNKSERWEDEYAVAYAHTLGTAVAMATTPSPADSPEESNPVVLWNADPSRSSTSLSEEVPTTLTAGQAGTWGDSMWWGDVSRNLLVRPDSATPLSSIEDGAAPRRVLPADQRHMRVGKTGMKNWVDLSSKSPTFGKVSRVLRPEIQEHLFTQASRLHAAGIENLVMHRLPGTQESSELLADELWMELGRVPFLEAWGRSSEILRKSEFAFPTWVNLVPLKDAAGGLPGNHPLVQRSYIHLPFSGL